MERKVIKWIIISIVLLSFILSPISIHIISLNGIYYQIVYETDIPDSNVIINKVETFEYYEYLIMHDFLGQSYNISKFDQNLDDFKYIDRDGINYIKNQINQDRQRFHWTIHRHRLYYKLNATNESKLYFSYSNSTIFNATYENNKEIFVTEYFEFYGHFYGNWYINFTLVPYVYNQSNRFLLTNVYSIKMFVDYSITRLAGEGHYIKQYIVLSSDLQVIFIYSHDAHHS